ncbi:hypothetical protein BV25DRAFT_1466724 [Artomyces pyxidatus]|uniref:Uncharacterized protein n=1 Tax=Artomyces pyxidatus TaxID=48021 RepID=A0ACB8SKZ3_9AGAM|nr:hypothetical protein BV25DRAFT_1466724 [Artomyces pyxidatus]
MYCLRAPVYLAAMMLTLVVSVQALPVAEGALRISCCVGGILMTVASGSRRTRSHLVLAQAFSPVRGGLSIGAYCR